MTQWVIIVCDLSVSVQTQLGSFGVMQVKSCSVLIHKANKKMKQIGKQGDHDEESAFRRAFAIKKYIKEINISSNT